MGKDVEDHSMPPEFAEYWQTFVVLHRQRGVGMSGPVPISFCDIKAYCDLTGSKICRYGLELITKFDFELRKALKNG